MAIAQGSVSQVSYVEESTWGTTPGTPAMVGVPYTSFNLNLTKAVYEDESIQADRNVRCSLQGNHQVSGELAVNLSHGNYDFLLESVLQSSFATNELKNGVTQKSFTFEDGATDIDQYSVFTGVIANTMTMSVPVDGVVTASFGLFGKSMTVSGTPLDASVTAPTAKCPFTHLGGTFKEGGSSVGTITGISLNVDNTGSLNPALGTNTAAGVSFGLCKITGTLDVYYTDASLITKFLNGTYSEVEFTLTDGTNTLTFFLPKVRYNGADKSIGNPGARTITLPFTALYDVVEGSTIVVTRSA